MMKFFVAVREHFVGASVPAFLPRTFFCPYSIVSQAYGFPFRLVFIVCIFMTADVFSLDTRSLAFFRILIGCAQLINIAQASYRPSTHAHSLAPHN